MPQSHTEAKKPIISTNEATAEVLKQESRLPSKIKEIDYRRVQLTWPKFVDRVNLDKRALGSILEHFYPIELSGEILHIGFTDSEMTAFHAEKVQREKDYFEAVTLEVFEKKLRLICNMTKKIIPPEIPVGEEPQTGQDSIFDNYPTVDSETALTASEEKLPKESVSELFKFVRQKELESPLKQIIQAFECDLVEVVKK